MAARLGDHGGQAVSRLARTLAALCAMFALEGGAGATEPAAPIASQPQGALAPSLAATIAARPKNLPRADAPPLDASIAAARAAGLDVLVWTLRPEDEDVLGTLLAHGVDGVLTDDPGGAVEARLAAGWTTRAS